MSKEFLQQQAQQQNQEAQAASPNRNAARTAELFSKKTNFFAKSAAKNTAARSASAPFAKRAPRQISARTAAIKLLRSFVTNAELSLIMIFAKTAILC